MRSFDDRPIADDHLDEILEAGRRTPSSQNWQPWDFILIRQRAQLLELAHVWQGAGHVAHAAVKSAIQCIMLAAAGLGIGTAHAGVGDQDMARRLLGFPDDKFCAYLISLGYPADRPLTPIKRPDRRPFDEVVHRDHW